MFYQLLYISTTTRPMLRIDIESILFTARRHNKRNEITGMLLSSRNRFMQILEGEKSQVEETYERICQDSRHRASVILRETESPERQFGDWMMASPFLQNGDFEQLADHVADTISGCDVITKSYLMGFTEENLAA